MFDRFRSHKDVEAGIIITSLGSRYLRFISQLDYKCLNNQVEYEELITGLKILISLKAFVIQVMDDP